MSLAPVSLDRNPVLWRDWHRWRPSAWVRWIWIAYAVLASFFSLYAIAQRLDTTGRPVGGSPYVRAGLVVGFQVAIGLLLVSVSSVTTLAEERASGSLELLLVSPLPTRAIVWGKWCGTYLRLAWLAFWPMVVTMFMGMVHRWPEQWLPVALVVGSTLAYGAALSSLGLAAAVWIAQLGRAVAVTVSVYAVVTIGWFFLVLGVKSGPTGAGLAAASPFYGPMYPFVFFLAKRNLGDEWQAMLWSLGWIAAYSLVAGGLYVATLNSFDRCLGRKIGPPRVGKGRAAVALTKARELEKQA